MSFSFPSALPCGKQTTGDSLLLLVRHENTGGSPGAFVSAFRFDNVPHWFYSDWNIGLGVLCEFLSCDLPLSINGGLKAQCVTFKGMK